MPGDVVTLQLGHYAGCVGAHWWGLQAAALLRPDAAELRSSALLRAGRDARAPHTPRLVALELKGGVGALGAGGTAGTPGTWDGDVADYRESSGGGSAPRDGGDSRDSTENAPSEGKGGSSASVPGAAPVQDGPVRLWSDYLNVRLHPKSLYVIPQYMHDGECGVLEAFGQGERLLQDPACLEELEDRLHFYVEECDYLQGFQVLCDLHDGFSGVGAKVTELLYDEYSRKGILSWGLTPLAGPADHGKNVCRLLNAALGTAHLARHSSLLCPLSLRGTLGIKPQPPVRFPYIDYDASLDYHSSAILAAALDALTVPFRLRAAPASMGHLAESLHFCGRKVEPPKPPRPLRFRPKRRELPSRFPPNRLWPRGLLSPSPSPAASRSTMPWVPAGRMCPGSRCRAAGTQRSAAASLSPWCCGGCAGRAAAARRPRSAPRRRCSASCAAPSPGPSARAACWSSRAPRRPRSPSSSLLCWADAGSSWTDPPLAPPQRWRASRCWRRCRRPRGCAGCSGGCAGTCAGWTRGAGPASSRPAWSRRSCRRRWRSWRRWPSATGTGSGTRTTRTTPIPTELALFRIPVEFGSQALPCHFRTA
ncbi:protein misato homolog 1 isoform X1 [Columba livia]|uniref:protein misato homolog 1 isoform X1 n=1 Tax=Columba livia TaxID=8932 RepID=UPI0031BABBED